MKETDIAGIFSHLTIALVGKATNLIVPAIA